MKWPRGENIADAIPFRKRRLRAALLTSSALISWFLFCYVPLLDTGKSKPITKTMNTILRLIAAFGFARPAGPLRIIWDTSSLT
jgi:hypothetical protein